VAIAFFIFFGVGSIIKLLNKKPMKTLKFVLYLLLASVSSSLNGQELFTAPASGTHSRWISAENPLGEKGKGGMTNKGAKGNAFYIIQPGETKEIFNVKGAGIIERMWFSGTIVKTPEQLRAVRIDMYWDGEAKPAVSAPIGDFFGIAHGLTARYDNELFSSPEGRSFNFTIPMPFRKSGLITITNESSSEVWFWYDINYLVMKRLPADAMYFHAFWNRDPKTTPGQDYVILPEVKGLGRYLGTNIGVIGDSVYNGTWFGEGEVKVYLDGDNEYPTLVGTGTEDYIGSGWGQGEFSSRYFGSLVANTKSDIYAFYRYHIKDPVYFHSGCKVTIHQMGNQSKARLLSIIEKGVDLVPVWFIGTENDKSIHRRLLDEENPPKLGNKEFPDVGINFYRSDDVCATAYFYLDKPANNLPVLPSKEVRLKDLNEKVWKRIEER
jgi:hypothetical protein